MSKMMKRILSLSAAVAMLCALSLPASAHGGRHGGRAASSATVYCDYCDQYHASGAHHNGGRHGGHH